MCKCSNEHFAIIVRATQFCLREFCIPTSKKSRRLPQWEDKTGLGLFRHSHLTIPTLPVQVACINWFLVLFASSYNLNPNHASL